MKLISILFFILLFGCNKSRNYKPLFPKDETSVSERRNKLFVFIGEKISVEEIIDTTPSMDAGFVGKYKILERIYGDFPNDTISFQAYDHFGQPAFSRYKNVMLFVSEYEGKYYHEKYQYFDVYKTDENKWAAPYKASVDYGLIKPNPISFPKDIFFSTDTVYYNGQAFFKSYEAPYYKIIDHKAYPMYGNEMQDLFAIKKNGVLKWRGLFGKGNENWADSLLETEMAPIDTSKKLFYSPHH